MRTMNFYIPSEMSRMELNKQIFNEELDYVEHRNKWSASQN